MKYILKTKPKKKKFKSGDIVIQRKSSFVKEEKIPTIGVVTQSGSMMLIITVIAGKKGERGTQMVVNANKFRHFKKDEELLIK